MNPNIKNTHSSSFTAKQLQHHICFEVEFLNPSKICPLPTFSYNLGCIYQSSTWYRPKTQAAQCQTHKSSYLILIFLCIFVPWYSEENEKFKLNQRNLKEQDWMWTSLVLLWKLILYRFIDYIYKTWKVPNRVAGALVSLPSPVQSRIYSS
jgi:hypothetical protein